LADNAGSGIWLELSLRASNDAVDAITEVFRAHGVGGVAVEPVILPGADEGFEVDCDESRIVAFIRGDQESEGRARHIEEAIWHLQAFDLAPISRLERRHVDEEDWANAWKEHFHPLRIGKHFVVKPTWRDFDSRPDDVVIELDSGMAFGTGLHPTTRMVIEEMEGCVTPGQQILDMGTGSGILAVAAAKLGASQVIAIDADPVACQIAAENAVLNGVDGIVKVATGAEPPFNGRFDVILANIVAAVIAGMASDLARLMDAHSFLIVSGIIEQRVSLVAEALGASGLKVVRTRMSGDWICQVVKLA
jgi:ribosomal protein L11 methyltransferase